jgi:hypothetical protein
MIMPFYVNNYMLHLNTDNIYEMECLYLLWFIQIKNSNADTNYFVMANFSRTKELKWIVVHNILAPLKNKVCSLAIWL